MPDQLNVATATVIEERSDLGDTPDALVRFWRGQLQLSFNQDRDWIERGRKIVQRYRDERHMVRLNREVRYNILWSNVETLKPVLYGRVPKPDVSRRHKDDSDPSAALGAELLQRCLSWEDDIEEFDSVMQAVVEDRLLPGRGVARVFYEPEYGEEEDLLGGEGNEGEEEEPQGIRNPATALAKPLDEEQRAAPNRFRPVIHERAPIRYVFWEDYAESPARTEAEIWWKGYRSFLTREQLIERFGEELGGAIDLDYTPSGVTVDPDTGPPPDAFKKATIWEIWDATRKEVVWISKKYNKSVLDKRHDPLELPGFFPSPPCILATTTNDTRTPVADFVEYQDQAQELDNLTARIDRLVRALKVAGVYAGSEKAVLRQLVDDASENRLIPVEDWASFMDKGGLPNLISWLPIQQIADTLVRLYDARDRILAIIYQTTGIADILRGETNPTETLGAQQLKSQFATRRISKAQKDVAKFARNLLRLRGAVMAKHFDPETLGKMSGLPEALTPLPPPPPMMIPAPPSAMPQPQLPAPTAPSPPPQAPGAALPPGVVAPGRPAAGMPLGPPGGPPGAPGGPGGPGGLPPGMMAPVPALGGLRAA